MERAHLVRERELEAAAAHRSDALNNLPAAPPQPDPEVARLLSKASWGLRMLSERMDHM